MSKEHATGDDVLGKLSISHLLRKAATDDTISTAEVANSVLSRKQADAFIDLVVDTSVLLKSVRTARIDHPSGEINKLDLGNIVTESADATGFSTHKPTASKVNYDTKKIRSGFDITSDFTEDNLEGTGIRDKLLRMFTKRISIDLELLALQGDEAAAPIDGTLEQRLFGANDGYLKILTDRVPGGQQIDADGANASTALFYQMKNKIPARYRVAGPDYRWIVSSRTWDKWNFDLTSIKGDLSSGAAAPSETMARYRETGGGGRPLGIPMVEIPLMPVDLSYNTTETDGTKIILSPLANMIFFIQREITIEWDRVPRADKWEVTIHSRNDFQVENEDMVVLANDVGVDGADFVIA